MLQLMKALLSDSDSDSEYLSQIPNINSQELQVDNNTQLKQIRNRIATLSFKHYQRIAEIILEEPTG